jgi:valyl-tRNA synthetase
MDDVIREMPKAYEPADIEKKWYPLWENRKYFHGCPNPNKPAYSIVIPPPNITGILTLGHVLNNTLQDILARWHRMIGDEVSWFPGTDHAGIATESRVQRYLREKHNTGRDELGRDVFIRKVWEWRNEYGGTIIRQLRCLGASCDWERERFTMDEGLSYAVRKVFVDLYNKGYIYRGRRMINWCPVSKTALSDEEVIYKEVKGNFYHYKYPLSDGSGFLEIATTRPETMLGDTAVAVHPADIRYMHLIGKTVKLPLTDREIPIIGDEYADPAKGTGCVKITPAHDPNDFEVGTRHNLEFINVMNDNATMNDKAGQRYAGLDRFECRKKIIHDLESDGLMVKIEPIVHNVGYSERGDVPIETIISEQWFAKMGELSKPAIAAVRDGKIKFHPERWSKTYFHWMENIKDWCISRQIWWGHRIPAWYNKHNGEIFVGMDAPTGDAWLQDNDVLDTWFSSWLWPFSVMGWPEDTAELKYFYPTGDLVTGPDIIFFWVARMIMAGYEFKQDLPFRNVYFTSIIRDDLGRKLSKSLGNSPDPLDVIATYGADALRFSITYIAPVGMDIRYSNDKCEIGRNFANKLWNACRFRQMQGDVTQSFENLATITDFTKLTVDEKWMLALLNKAIIMADTALKEYRFHYAAHEIYELVWSNFCDWFIEAEKIRLRSGGENKTQAIAILDFVIYKILRLLHPFMPFITEELAHQMGFLNDAETIMYAAYPQPISMKGIPVEPDNSELLELVNGKFQLVSSGRALKANYNIPNGQKVKYYIKAINDSTQAFLVNELDSLTFLLNANELEISIADYNTADGAAPSIMANIGTIYMPLHGLIDIDAERKKMQLQKEQLLGWIKGSEAKLNNPGFVDKAPENVVREAKVYYEDLKQKLVRTNELIDSLK